MGAVAAILYCNLEHRQLISGMVLDSPFTTAKTMLCDLVSEEVGVPRFLTKTALFVIQSNIETLTGVDSLGLKPREMVQNLRVPACFMIARGDKLVLPA